MSCIEKIGFLWIGMDKAWEWRTTYMKYQSAKNVLPQELLEQIQEYVQGEYLYIPIKSKRSAESVTDYKTELEKRDAQIYRKYLEGVGRRHLSEIYHLSESSIRRIIINQRKEYTVMNIKITEILNQWGLEEREIKQIYDTAWQVGDDYVLKVYHDVEMLERNLKILQILGEMNIPVGEIVPTRSHERYAVYDDIFCFLSKKLSGKNIIRIDDAEKVAMKMGEIIADLHIAFQKCESEDVFWNNSLLEEMNGWVKNNLEKNHWSYIDKEAYEETVSRLESVYDQLPVQLIHRDVHFGNFLFADGEFCGYIDFDLSQRNIRIFDLCYFLLGLLSEEEKLGITQEQWFEMVKNVFAGYGSKLELSVAEKRAVPYVMECIELLFVAYFEEIQDVRCAQNAFEIYEFVKRQENRIQKFM